MGKKQKAKSPPVEGVAEAAPEKGKKKWLLIGLLLLVACLVLAGGGAWYLMGGGKDTPEEINAPAEKKADAADVDVPLQETTEMDRALEANVFPLEPFVIELMDPDAKKMLTLEVALEMMQAETADEIRNMLPYIRETVMQQFIQESSGDLLTMEDKLVLKHDLIRKINGLLSYGRIRNIYFTQFLIR
ncbi:MAG: hypothetical protein CSA22_09135 [Deltaproteobacteria bacterium]|nr:MAG: hypothetical protein CSA22_09135 [Deltaproteobacteria bacterium]